MNRFIVAILVILIATGIWLGIKDANNGMISTASAGIVAHNAEIERVAKEVGN
ncbi:MAG: hypothetical protein ACLQF0_05505 [Dissulfurispiraceae bacterium]